MAFCDFCSCDRCRDGSDLIQHAQTEDGRWICDVCYTYDVCINAFLDRGLRRGPCGDYAGDLPCTHRPKLVTDWLDKDPKATEKLTST